MPVNKTASRLEYLFFFILLLVWLDSNCLNPKNRPLLQDSKLHTAPIFFGPDQSQVSKFAHDTNIFGSDQSAPRCQKCMRNLGSAIFGVQTFRLQFFLTLIHRYQLILGLYQKSRQYLLICLKNNQKIETVLVTVTFPYTKALAPWYRCCHQAGELNNIKTYFYLQDNMITFFT